MAHLALHINRICFRRVRPLRSPSIRSIFSNTRVDQRKNRWLGSLLVSILLSCAAACENKQQSQTSAFENDATATSQLRRISITLAQVQRISEQDMATLKELNLKYPAARPVRQALENALVLWKDWDGVAQLLTSVPKSERSREEKILLTTAYLTIGHYQDAVNEAEPAAEAAPSDMELNALAGRSLYHLNRFNDAARMFDRVWSSLVAAQRSEDVMLRGLIYFYENNPQKAIETLKLSLTFQPDYYPAYGALSRVYQKTGDTKQAEDNQRQATEALARQTTQRARLSRMASKLRELELAWSEHRYEDVVRLTQDLLREDPESQQRQVLYQYLGQAYQALGRNVEAQTAFSEAAKPAPQQPN